jgi:hypothetical protein
LCISFKRFVGSLNFFLMLALPRRASFWTTFYGLYFSYQCTHITNYIFLHDLDHLWAASMYCIYTCLSYLWVLIHVLVCTSVFLCGLESHVVHFWWSSSLFILAVEPSFL